jgi:HPt (histidine-containing phosphotransfer) domain-containing protein
MAEFDTVADVRKYLKDEFGMDTEDCDEMVDILFESLEKQIGEIQLKLAAGDIAGIGNSGHAIKGAAANVGAVNISAIGKGMEEAGKASDSAKCAELLSQLQNVYAALKTSS